MKKKQVPQMDFIYRIMKFDLEKAQKSNKDLGLFPLKKGEHPVGIMSDSLKKTYLMHRQLEKETFPEIGELMVKRDSLIREHEESHRFEGHMLKMKGCNKFWGRIAKMNHEIGRLQQRVEMMKGIFFGMVYEEFPQLYGKPSVGVRKNYQVVWTGHTEPPRKKRALKACCKKSGSENPFPEAFVRN